MFDRICEVHREITGTQQVIVDDLYVKSLSVSKMPITWVTQRDWDLGHDFNNPKPKKMYTLSAERQAQIESGRALICQHSGVDAIPFEDTAHARGFFPI